MGRGGGRVEEVTHGAGPDGTMSRRSSTGDGERLGEFVSLKW